MEEIFSYGTEIFEDGVVAFILTAVFSFIAAKVLVKLIVKAEESTIAIRGKERATSINYIVKIVSFLIYAIAAMVVLSKIKYLASLGKAMLGATSVLAVGVSLAAQETFGNFIAGFSLALTQPFQVGDLVTLPEKGISGTVIEITFRHTIVMTIEKTRIILPNSIMNTSVIEDKAPSEHSYRKFITVGVHYDTDIPLAKKIISEIVSGHPEFVDIRTKAEKKKNVPIVQVRVEEFEASDILLKFPVTTKSISESFMMASDVREEILKRFKENGITIPYQIVTVEMNENK